MIYLYNKQADYNKTDYEMYISTSKNGLIHIYRCHIEIRRLSTSICVTTDNKLRTVRF